ncbi:S8 family serine peptidase [Candidatus Poriferisocius sp.]|uniref:S8 family serine peptidase n=1 Tax=Candidatus Poriferisocius sp. TaxID=3101276 RepID=UPI003B02C99E
MLVVLVVTGQLSLSGAAPEADTVNSTLIPMKLPVVTTSPAEILDIRSTPTMSVSPLQVANINDPESSKQWYLDAINADELQEGWPEGAHVSVGVFDISFDITHRDLDDNIQNEDTTSCSLVASLGSHGTKVSGVIAAEMNGVDGIGVAPLAKIVPRRYDCYGDMFSDMYSDIIQLIVNNEVDIINMSFGIFSYDDNERFANDIDDLAGGKILESLVRIAQAQGIIVVAAAGNCGKFEKSSVEIEPSEVPAVPFDQRCIEADNIVYPAGFPGVVTVGATTETGSKAWFSSKGTQQDHAAGKRIDIAAPGNNILSTVPGNMMASSWGTSLAAPVISGILAHLIARFPEADSELILRALYETAENPNGEELTDEFGHGIVKPLEAIKWLEDNIGSTPNDEILDESPVVEVTDSQPVNKYNSIATGWAHSCGLHVDGVITCWGSNTAGQLDVPDGRFVAVSAGSWHSCGLRVDEAIVCWGDGGYGQLDVPDGRFVAVSAGSWHSCGLRVDEAIVCWGDGGYGQLDVPDGRFVAVSAGWAHSCGLHINGAIACWGSNYDWFQNDTYQARPPVGRFAAISSGPWHSCGLHVSGVIVLCWGDGGYGQLDVPDGRFVAVSAGWAHSCGLRVDETIVCWGDGRQGQLDVPDGRFVAVSAGWAHSCGLRVDETIVCWGDGRYGQSDAPGGTKTKEE